MAAATLFSAPGAMLFGNNAVSLANPETEDERKKRLAAVASAGAAAQSALGTTPGSTSMSAAGRLLGLGGYTAV